LVPPYEQMRQAYHRICARIGFRYRAVEADAGAIGGSGSQEFMVLADTGEDTILFCDRCQYAANQEQAQSRLEEFPQDQELRPMEAVLGENLIGVEPLAKFLGIPVWKTTKTMIFEADDQVVGVMVRGDCDVNETKVRNALACKQLRLAAPELIKRLTGAEVGYAGPIGLPAEVRCLADRYVGNRVNFECGANRTNYHNINVNFGRDLPGPEMGDFKLAKEGGLCPNCEGRLQAARGIEVGHILKPGAKYSKPMNCCYVDAAGKSQLILMGCYGIGITRMAAAWVEQNHDDKGIIWPPQIAPFDVHLVGLNLEDPAVRTQAGEIYAQLRQAGLDVLYDDRSVRAGEKFSDADLIGIPVRLTVSKRTLEQGMVEFKMRREAKAELLSIGEAQARIKSN
jgi:prolyl-tRNA synthetase